MAKAEGIKSGQKDLTFLRLEPVIEILKAAIWTGRIAEERPVSILLIAEQESAKTELLKFFYGTPTLKYKSDLTSRGLQKDAKEIEAGKIRHLVLLDIIRIVHHGRGVSERTLQNLAALMEEGESETSDAGETFTWKGFPRIGVLMAITPKFFESRQGGWRKTGFLTRFLPVCYRYSPETVHAVHTAIRNGHHPPVPKPIETGESPAFNRGVRIPPKESLMIQREAESLGQKMKVYGFRYQHAMRALSKAHAIIKGRGTVDFADVEKIVEWSKFFTMEQIEL